MKLNVMWRILKETVSEFLEDRVLRLSAATAYYAMFSIAPLLVLVVGVAGLVFGPAQVQQEVRQQVEGFVGRQSAQMIESMMSAQHQGGSLMATIIGGIGLVVGATGVFGQLQDSLNTVWGVTTKPGHSVGALIRDRVFSMAMVLGIGFLLLVSMALSAFVTAFARYVGTVMSVPQWVGPVLNGMLSFGVITVLFALIFKVLPDVKVRWRDVWIGGVGTALLFELGKFLLGLYLSRQLSTSAYGAGSAFVVILLYVYYSSVILYFGAEFTQVQAKFTGAKIQPSKYAVRITGEQRAHQGIPTNQQVEATTRQQRPEAARKPEKAWRKAA